ncbi:UNVERIFIED_CONTAM: Neutral ceramidase 2 [Sesamum angustifolium]|uniref:Neutral ceramidase n=1 Tax=Sesamum angustifolium TaxID=2727405 RepID=A0AAW2QS78_9LAMI
MMGYANMDQTASGVHFRLRARAFVVAEPQGKRVVFVNLDACMASQLVTIKVLERLKARISFEMHHDAIAGPQISGELLDAGVNRSPSAYLNNPVAERSKYKYDVDKDMTLLKFVDDEWGPVGSFNWFATHGTSMSRTNSLISGDNKGAAARFMEDWFDQSNGGSTSTDVSKINKIPRRISSIIPLVKDTLPVVERMSYAMAGDLGGGTNVVKTCPAAMGFAFAAGTTDGPGAFDFKQGDDSGNAFWRLVRNLLKTPSKEQNDCQTPKPILLDTGEMEQPYDWAPSILPVQILRIGQLVILSVPGASGFSQCFLATFLSLLAEADCAELGTGYSWLFPTSFRFKFTTMAGRRLRDAVKTVLTSGDSKEFGSNVHVVIAGLTNTYSQYVTTFEEYQIQRYEGASTLYGPHTLSGYIQEFKKLAAALISGQSVESGPQPPDLLDKQISLLTPVVMDATPLGVNFGEVSLDVPKNSTFKRGDNVTVVFWSACPRNDLMTEGTFALVEILKGKDSWLPAYDDDDFCLRFIWSRPAKLSTEVMQPYNG